jgi:hypothetical protein
VRDENETTESGIGVLAGRALLAADARDHPGDPGNVGLVYGRLITTPAGPPLAARSPGRRRRLSGDTLITSNVLLQT